MKWLVYFVWFVIGSLLFSILMTVVQVWLRKKLGRHVRPTRRDESYLRPF